MDYTCLFKPIKINKLEVKNRVFVPPMGTSACSKKGKITDGVVTYFGNVAKGGAGLITSEVADVDPNRRYNANVMGAFDDSLIPGWKRLAEAVHEHGAKLFAQLIHAGQIPLLDAPGQLGAVGPSPIPHIYNRNVIPHVLSKEEMDEIKQLYINAVEG